MDPFNNHQLKEVPPSSPYLRLRPGYEGLSFSCMPTPSTLNMLTKNICTILVPNCMINNDWAA